MEVSPAGNGAGKAWHVSDTAGHRVRCFWDLLFARWQEEMRNRKQQSSHGRWSEMHPEEECGNRKAHATIELIVFKCCS